MGGAYFFPSFFNLASQMELCDVMKGPLARRQAGGGTFFPTIRFRKSSRD